MKIEITYEERFSKNIKIDKENAIKAINNKSLSEVTIQKRGTCLLDGEVREFMQTTVFFKKD